MTALPPRQPATPAAPSAFDGVLEHSFRERLRRAQRPEVALDGGLDLAGLCRYAAGSPRDGERGLVETLLTRSPWAMERVAALIRAARSEAGGALARSTLEAARSDALDPARLVGRALLRSRAQDELERRVAAGDGEALEAAGDAVLRAACALALGRGREALAGLPTTPPDALTALARRVAEADGEEAALLALLEHFD